MKKIRLENHQNNQFLSIDSLPNDILIEIFKYFDENSIKSALNVCKKWTEIIKYSPSLTKFLEIKVKGSYKNDQNLSISIPIDGLMYRKLHIVGRIAKDLKNLELVNLMKNYGSNIHQLVLVDFICDANLIHECKNVKKLEIYGDCDVKHVQSFNGLTELILRVNSTRVIKSFEHKEIRLATFKLLFNESTKLDENDKKNINEFIKKQKNFLKNLSITKFPIDINLISNLLSFEHLTRIELEINAIEAHHVLLFSQKWKNVKIVNPKLTNKNFVLNSVREIQGIKSLSVKYTDSGTSLPSSTSIFEEISNFKSGLFLFMEPKKVLNDFFHLQKLSIKRIDNETQIKNLTKFLTNCTNLKVLNLNLVSNRAKIDKNLINLLKSAENLEHLIIDAYSDKLEISSDTFKNLKFLQTNLKKLSIKVANQQLSDMKYKARMLIGTKIQTIVMEKEIQLTCLESCDKSRESNDGICILMK